MAQIVEKCLLRMEAEAFLVFKCITATIRFFRYYVMRRAFKNMGISSCGPDHSSLKVPLFVFSPLESPLQFYVNYPNSGSVSAYGPGLIYGVANKPATFTIVTEDAGEGKSVL